MPAPRKGLCLAATALEAHDGDTLRVRVELVATVRLCGDGQKRQCWAPELSEPGGIASRDHLVRQAVGQAGRLWIPTDDLTNLAQLFTFGRLLGDFYVGDRSLSDEQIAAGHASSRKGGPLGQ